MRDWLVTDQADRNLLVAVQQASDGWLPWRGSFARVNRLWRNGLVQKAGTAAMPPHVLYVLTDKGREELEVAARLAKS